MTERSQPDQCSLKEAVPGHHGMLSNRLVVSELSGSLDMKDTLQEECGPLGMGSRGVNELTTPQKERGPHGMHKGLIKLAHRVSPMRIKRPGASPYGSPRQC